MSRIRYAVLGRWRAVSEVEATRLRQHHDARYRARLWSNPVVRVQEQTETLERLTGQINEQTEDMRQQVRALDEDRALAELRDTFDEGSKE